MSQSPQFRAEADINTSVFVSLGTKDDNVVTSGAGDLAIGVMHESIWATPIPGADADVAVPLGQSKRVYGADEVCEVRVGTGGLTVGDLVTPDAAGAGVVAGAGANYSAVCLSGGLAGDRAKVVVAKGSVPV